MFFARNISANFERLNKEFDGKINIESRVTNSFECHFNSIISVDDVNSAGNSGCKDGLVECNEDGKTFFNFLK